LRAGRKLWWFYLIALAVFLADQVSKKWIEQNLGPGDKIEVLGNFFVITFIKNPGAAFGILKEQTVFFLIVTVIVVSGIVWYMHRAYRTSGPLPPVGLALILGGAIGNFVDRAIYGEVVDFLQFTFGTWVFPIFNLADTGITVGVCLLLLDAVLAFARKDDRKDGDKTEEERDRQGEERPQFDG